MSTIREWWDVVMDEEMNPLMRLPRVVRFQIMMYLSCFWCMIFTVWTGWVLFLGPSMVAHALILIGIFFTAKVFRDAKKEQLGKMTHRDFYRDPKDGGVKYDDIWGG